MEWIGVVVPAFLVAAAVAAAVGRIRQQMRLQRAWASGLTAEGVCLRSWTTVSSNRNGGSTTHHHVYEFTPHGAAGPVRFEERHGSAKVVQGDRVTVHYPADRPERATAVRPGHRQLVGTVATLVFLLAFVAFAVWFAYAWLTFPALG